MRRRRRRRPRRRDLAWCKYESFDREERHGLIILGRFLRMPPPEN